MSKTFENAEDAKQACDNSDGRLPSLVRQRSHSREAVTVSGTGPTDALDGVDRSYLVNTLSWLATVPTDVPMGYDTLMEPDDPKLVGYVQQVMRPELVRLGVYDLLDAPRNNLIARLGSGASGRSLLIQNYTPTQHNNLMENPFSGHVGSGRAYGVDEPVVFGQGVSQCKAHQAVMLTVLKCLIERGVDLRGRLYWAINNEGRSSHACSDVILDTIGEQPEFGIIQISTGLGISLGNRGRVDVDVHIQGKAAHSSQPEQALSAIDAAAEVVGRLRSLEWTDRHPLLGERHAVVYKIRYEPVAPHTLPSDAFMAIDRRLLPGDDPAIATDEVREAIGDLAPYDVTVEQGVTMLPALVDPEHPGVHALSTAHESVVGEPPHTFYGQGSFDAGGPCVRGVPTVMYGAGGGAGLTGADFVPISMVEREASILLKMILAELG